ncbi:uncharacterized protein LOC142227491 [Haematobia irritans]|uniref:uncharacterized protein LOC142227491 n=1 Tax=Haematobia irritans TaxID=7368 RepID=UPI003F4FD24A
MFHMLKKQTINWSKTKVFTNCRYTNGDKPKYSYLESALKRLQEGPRFLSTENECHDAHFNSFTEILQEAKRDILQKYNLGHIEKRINQSFDYNFPHRAHLGYSILLSTYKELTHCETLNKESQKELHILGCCLELMFIAFTICDDIMDNSSIRFGRPCWHTLENIGMSALNDSFIFQNLTFYLLRKYFENSNKYLKILNTFHEVQLITACGQNMDMMCSKMPMTSFTMDMYREIVASKSAYSFFYLPFAWAMHLAGINNLQKLQNLKEISLNLAFLFQAQNDFLDCFGTPEHTCTIGTDISENKCTWLAVECINRASREQMDIMVQCYGRNDFDMVQRVIDLYLLLDLPSVYESYEIELVNTITDDIQRMPDDLPQGAILGILRKIQQRKLL